MGVVTIHDQDVGGEEILPLPITIFEGHADMIKGSCRFEVFGATDFLLSWIAAVRFHASKIRYVKCKIHF